MDREERELMGESPRSSVRLSVRVTLPLVATALVAAACSSSGGGGVR